MSDEKRSLFNRGAFREKYLMRKKSFFTPQTWNNFISEVANALASVTVTSFKGGNVAQSSAGTALAVDAVGGAAAALRPLLTQDVSGGGANGLISVTAGTITDLTHSGTVWTGTTGPNIIYINDPVAGNVPFALALTGPPVRQPALQLDPAATCAYLSATVDATTGFITAYAILADTGGGMPASTNVLFNALLTTLAVTITSGVASVKINNDGAQSNLFFAICSPSTALPLTDGTSYRAGT